MKFGKVEDLSNIDFTLPIDNHHTKRLLAEKGGNQPLQIYIGCAKWNKNDLKGFYPKGVKDELAYYATQFNAVELNSLFYGMPSAQQVAIWRDKTPENFKFFPKITSTISHYKRLNDVSHEITQYATAIMHFEEKLGMIFLQLHENFAPKDFSKLEKFVKEWPMELPLSVEVRHPQWFSDEVVFDEFSSLLEDYKMSNSIVDTAGRRDMLHMRLTCPTAFIRYTGANAPSDYTRLDDWVGRIKTWQEQGLENLYFFVHQNVELESPLLSAYFIENLNKNLGTKLKIPKLANAMPTLFG